MITWYYIMFQDLEDLCNPINQDFSHDFVASCMDKTATQKYEMDQWIFTYKVLKVQWYRVIVYTATRKISPCLVWVQYQKKIQLSEEITNVLGEARYFSMISSKTM